MQLLLGPPVRTTDTAPVRTTDSEEYASSVEYARCAPFSRLAHDADCSPRAAPLFFNGLLAVQVAFGLAASLFPSAAYPGPSRLAFEEVG